MPPLGPCLQAQGGSVSPSARRSPASLWAQILASRTPLEPALSAASPRGTAVARSEPSAAAAPRVRGHLGVPVGTGGPQRGCVGLEGRGPPGVHGVSGQRHGWAQSRRGTCGRPRAAPCALRVPEAVCSPGGREGGRRGVPAGSRSAQPRDGTAINSGRCCHLPSLLSPPVTRTALPGTRAERSGCAAGHRTPAATRERQRRGHRSHAGTRRGSGAERAGPRGAAQRGRSGAAATPKHRTRAHGPARPLQKYRALTATAAPGGACLGAAGPAAPRRSSRRPAPLPPVPAVPAPRHAALPTALGRGAQRDALKPPLSRPFIPPLRSRAARAVNAGRRRGRVRHGREPPGRGVAGSGARPPTAGRPLRGHGGRERRSLELSAAP